MAKRKDEDVSENPMNLKDHLLAQLNERTPYRIVGCFIFLSVLGFLVGCPKPVVYRLPNFIPPVETWDVKPEAPAVEILERAWRDLKKGRIEDARNAALHAQGTEPSWASPLVVEGFSYYLERRWDLALQTFQQALKINSQHLGALYGMMLGYEARGEPEASLPYGEMLLRQYPGDTLLAEHFRVLELNAINRMIKLARQASRAGADDQASYWYRRVIARTPTDSSLLMEYANWLRTRGHLREAIVYYQLAYNHNPQSFPITEALAGALFDDGRCEQAIELYQKLIQADPVKETWRNHWEECQNQLEKSRYHEEYEKVRSGPVVSRAQLAMIIGLEFPEVMEIPDPSNPIIIEDVGDHWASRFVFKMVAAGFISLFGGHRFEPQRLVNRGEFSEICYQILQYYGADALVRPQSSTGILDISPLHRQYRAITMVTALGLLSLDPQGAFQADRFVTGEEAIRAIQALRNFVRARVGP